VQLLNLQPPAASISGNQPFGQRVGCMSGFVFRRTNVNLNVDWQERQAVNLLGFQTNYHTLDDRVAVVCEFVSDAAILETLDPRNSC
jgi:hypothetical protein